MNIEKRELLRKQKEHQKFPHMRGNGAKTQFFFLKGCETGNLTWVKANLWNTLRDGWDMNDIIDGKTGLDIAIENKNQNIVEYLTLVDALGNIYEKV